MVSSPTLEPAPPPRLLRARALQLFAELAIRVHLADDVATTEKLPVYIELRNRRPVREFFDALPHLRVRQHVYRLEGNPFFLQDLHDLIGEPALREGFIALHEEDHLVLVD